MTVQLILDNYPVKSITKLGERFFHLVLGMMMRRSLTEKPLA
ncbi:hypothetical protein [Moritella sp. PE36]|nr:hypothetical protein [Moritella sp. PE36]